ncbi:MAG: chromate resistance protein ChrB domain-containing protein [Gemmatimonadales bacterium]
MASWLMLIHQIPPKPDYLRVKVRRRLQQLGAIAVKSTVYVLPNTDDALEDFQWLRREIRADGGEAMLFDAEAIEGISAAGLEARFRAERDAEYQAIAEAAGTAGSESDLDRLTEQLRQVVQRDHFDSAGRQRAETALRALAIRRDPEGARPPSGPRHDRPRGATWVTRQGVKIDRMASAWLVRRWIDPDARFRFVPASEPRLGPDELGFDLYQGGFTHEGDRSTFETLLVHFGLEDPGLAMVGQVVHDIDCKDDKFRRPEAPGIAAVIEGIVRAHRADEERLEAAAALFDGLHASFGGKAP